jgi:glycosyltransferase involved in cell wall biosynthesis
LLTLVIPTKNRPNDIQKAIKSVLFQTKLPDELIVVDQSKNNLSKLAITKIVINCQKIKLIYIHDTKIKGLVDAKRVGVENASGKIICFIEDDVYLEPGYLEEIESGFKKYPNMLGCCGVVTNQLKTRRLYILLFHFFHIGIFADPRVALNFLPPKFNKKSLILSDKLSGGISAWKRNVFKTISFDLYNDFHMLEDIDFSTRVAKHFGNCLFINPNVKLAHYCSQTNRDALDIRQRRKVRECFAYYKKRKDLPSAAISFYWLLIGMLLEALFQSFSCLSFKPIQGFLLGFIDGFAKKIIS